MSFLARRKRIEGWAVFVVNLQQEAEDESSVYVWDILGAKYAVSSSEGTRENQGFGPNSSLYNTQTPQPHTRL